MAAVDEIEVEEENNTERIREEIEKSLEATTSVHAIQVYTDLIGLTEPDE